MENSNPEVNFNSLFPNKVCINLDRRPERWKQAQAQFALNQFRAVRRFAAIDGVGLQVPADWKASAGAYGCLQSHMAVIREARREQLASILIFEDDVVLDPDFNGKFAQYVPQLPSDWDMLFFGGLHLWFRPQMISDNIARLVHSYSTFAYAIKDTVYDAFIDLNSESREPVDKNNVLLQRDFNCYCFMPPLAWVEENYSDTQGKFLFPWYVKEGIVIASPELERIQKDSVVIIAHRDRTPDRTQTRNLKFKLDYYSRWYPDITLLVVEHDQQFSIDPTTLPETVQYEILQGKGPFEPNRCFQAGFERFETSKEFFVFTDSDVHLDRENIMANLEQCLRYELVSSFKHLINLSEVDTKRLFKGEDVDLSGYVGWERNGISHGSFIFTRNGLKKIGGLGRASHEVNARIESLRSRGDLLVFESPNKALRLFQTSPEQA